MKKNLLIAGGVLIAALFIGGGFYLRSRAAKPTVSPLGNSNGLPAIGGSIGGNVPGSSGTLPVTASFEALTGESLAYFILPDTSILSVASDGKISRSNSSSSTLISTHVIADISAARFSADGKKVLVKSGNEASPSWRVYDIDKNSWRELSIDTRDAYFSPKGAVIAYFARKLSGETITTLDLARADSKPVSLVSFAAEDLDLAWAGTDRIIFGERSSAGVSGSLWSLDLKTRSVRQLLDNVPGASITWGNKDEGLLLTSGQNGGAFALVGKDLSTEQTFSFLTLPQKCVFYTSASSTASLLCAVPRDPQALRDAALPDDYQLGALMTSDDLLSINLGNGVVNRVMDDPSIIFDARGLTVSGGTAYFLNGWDHKVYKQALGL